MLYANYLRLTSFSAVMSVTDLDLSVPFGLELFSDVFNRVPTLSSILTCVHDGSVIRLID